MRGDIPLRNHDARLALKRVAKHDRETKWRRRTVLRALRRPTDARPSLCAQQARSRLSRRLSYSDMLTHQRRAARPREMSLKGERSMIGSPDDQTPKPRGKRNMGSKGAARARPLTSEWGRRGFEKEYSGAAGMRR